MQNSPGKATRPLKADPQPQGKAKRGKRAKRRQAVTNAAGGADQ